MSFSSAGDVRENSPIVTNSQDPKHEATFKAVVFRPLSHGHVFDIEKHPNGTTPIRNIFKNGIF